MLLATRWSHLAGKRHRSLRAGPRPDLSSDFLHGRRLCPQLSRAIVLTTGGSVGEGSVRFG